MGAERQVQQVHRCVAELNAAISAAQEAGFRINAEVMRWDIGRGVKGIWIEVLRPISPDKVPVALSEHA